MTTNSFYTQTQSFALLLKSMAFKLTNSIADAEDLVQDTYFKALNNLDKFSDGTNLKAWMLTIMRNIYINEFRKQKREYEVITKPGDITDNLLYEMSENSDDCVRLLINETIIDALNSLKPELKYVFLKYYEGFKYHEIAELTQLPLGTVKSRIFLARKDLVEFLRQNDVQQSNIA